MQRFCGAARRYTVAFRESAPLRRTRRRAVAGGARRGEGGGEEERGGRGRRGRSVAGRERYGRGTAWQATGRGGVSLLHRRGRPRALPSEGRRMFPPERRSCRRRWQAVFLRRNDVGAFSAGRDVHSPFFRTFRKKRAGSEKGVRLRQSDARRHFGKERRALLPERVLRR